MKKIFVILLAVVLLATAVPVSAKGKPTNPGGGKPDGGGDADLTAQIVCIDPGHGGSDPGTSGIVSGSILKESDLNLDVAKALRTSLETSGYTTYLTREGDDTKSNNDRYTLCNGTDATLLVSIHHNGSTNPGVDYTLGLYHKNRDVADTIGRAVAEEFGMLDTFRTDRFASGVLIKSKMPSMMSEGYFLTNADRLVQLIDHAGMVDREASALTTGIELYYSSITL